MRSKYQTLGEFIIENQNEFEYSTGELSRLINAIRLAAGIIARTKTDKIMAKAKAKIALLKLLTEEQRKKAHTMHSAYSSH